MARPLRFRCSPTPWTLDAVRSDLLADLDANIGAEMRGPWFRPPEGYEARRFEMDNGDVALFAWREGRGGAVPDDCAYWIGNTETPSALWRTEKYGFDAVPYAVERWAQRELLAQLHEESPWLADYPHLSWFFLPVLLSKDGRESTREFLRDHAAGFPDADGETALDFYEGFLSSGVLDDHRHVMAGKLGTSDHVDHVRMSAAMGEFNVAKLLHDAGYDVTPEIEMESGHALDFRADGALVEVTRPLPVAHRSAGTPAAAIRDTVATKTDGQLREHPDAMLVVDCSSFPDDAWYRVRDARPDVGHEPAAVVRLRPDGRVEGYTAGDPPVTLDLP
ncbi:MAG: DUF5784 family protein [Halobacteriaceae archaeon]